MSVQWLASPDGQSAIAALRGADPLTARRRFPDLDPQLITAALTQAKHRPDDFPLALVTPDGVQMATPAAVAVRRAQRLADQGVERVVDAGCGIGMDAWAFLQAGLQVVAYESDPYTAQIAAANLAGTGAEVINADVTTASLPQGTLYVDPARRRERRDVSGNALRINDPQQWSPPWDWVMQQAADRPVVARVRPGMRDTPPRAEWQCTSMGRRLVDATLWFPPLATTDRRASVFDGQVWHELTGPATATRVGAAGRYIIDPDPAIVRAGLVSNLADLLHGHLLDEHLAFVSCDEAPPAWAGRAMRVQSEVPLKAISETARRSGITSATVWARGFERVPDIGLPEGAGAIVVLARTGTRRQTRCWIGKRGGS